MKWSRMIAANARGFTIGVFLLVAWAVLTLLQLSIPTLIILVCFRYLGWF